MEIGQHGGVRTSPNGRGGVKAHTRFRHRDVEVREVEAHGDTKGAAKRKLNKKLETRKVTNTVGLTGSMTIEQAGRYWLDQRRQAPLQMRTRTPADPEKGPKRKRKRKLVKLRNVKPQTLAAYDDALRLIVIPTMGQVRLQEVRVGLLESLLADLDDRMSTAQARSVLSQIFAMAVRHDVLLANPMTAVTPLEREDDEVEVLTLEQVRLLRHLVRPEVQRIPGRRGPNGDLRDVIECSLGTGTRIGELLAVQWKHLDLDGELPTMRICGTLVEPRKGYVSKLYRQESTKTKTVRTLILPDAVARVLRARRARAKFTGPDDPVFATRTRNWIAPCNIRTRLRAALEDHDDLVGTTPHTLRRTVGTAVARKYGLDAVREQLGHTDPSIAYRDYVAAMPIAPDVRPALNPFFEDTVEADAPLATSCLSEEPIRAQTS